MIIITQPTAVVRFYDVYYDVPLYMIYYDEVCIVVACNTPFFK